MSKVFAIYPIDKSCSTSFLNRINTFETRKLGDIWHCYKVHFSDEDHERCIQQSKDSHFIFYMGHGGETQLHGACAKYGEMSVDLIAAKENKDFYNKENFIDANNINAFKGKIFFCFSCYSNRNSSKSLARLSRKFGVETFVGFGDIPTDYIDGTRFSKRCIAIYKGKIVKIIKYSLFYAVQNNETADNLVRIIKLLTCKEIQSLLFQDNFHGRDTVVKQLCRFKNEIKIFGNPYSNLELNDDR